MLKMCGMEGDKRAAEGIKIHLRQNVFDVRAHGEEAVTAL